MHINVPTSHTDESFGRLGRAKYFSKLDLKTGYYQIRVDPADVEKTAFKTKYGHFDFLVKPMGLRNAPDTFQALMNTIFRDCIDEFLVLYHYDILVFSDSREDHLHHIRIVLSKLKENELFVGRNKNELMKEETEFLCLTALINGAKIGEDRKKLVRDCPKPNNIT